jgi:CheY-like chemotaxis protein
MNSNDRSGQGTIMIVDDAPGNLAFLSDALEEAGYRVLVATDGFSALEQLRHVLPDVILLDVVMPGMDGFETCRHLKAEPATRNLPVIFMTALSELDHLLRGFEEGAVDYVVKPIRHQEVMARVATHMAQARLLRRSEEALSRSGFAAVAVDVAATVTWASPAGAAWLSELGGNQPGPGEPLPPELAEWVRTSGAAPGGQGLGPFEAQRDGRRYKAQLTLCGDGEERLLLLDVAQPEWDLDSLRSSLGLTPKEAEILMWIARGKTNRDVGLILGSSPRTINKHLEHIFEKLGVGTRAAAVAVAVDRLRLRTELPA